MSPIAAASLRSKTILGPHRPNIVIHIDNHYAAKVYTSGSTISGHVEVLTTRNVPFDNFAVSFVGFSATRLNFVQQYATRSCRTFLKLLMPIPECYLPNPRLFEAGQTYVIPYNFVVPHRLTIGACCHQVSSPAVREQHLRLPPSIGSWELDDGAPEMTSILYHIEVDASWDEASIMDAQHLIRVLPATPEDAPLDINANDDQYKLSKTKTIRKGLFYGRLGKLTASASQPAAVMLSADLREVTSSFARVNCEFSPDCASIAPPRIKAASGKLTTTTYFSGAPADHLPNLGGRSAYHAIGSLDYSDTNTLFATPIENVSWKQENPSAMRQYSGNSPTPAEGHSESDTTGPSGCRGNRPNFATHKCSLRYIAVIDIPFEIPISHKRILIPTFHNCLISRSYTLQLSLCVGATNTTLSLAVPVQVGVETIHSPLDGGELPSFEESDVDVLLQPRPTQISQERSDRRWTIDQRW